MIVPPPALAPSDDVAVILQAAAFGALIGTAVAARRRSGNPDFDAWLVTARWSVALAAVAVVWVVVEGLRLW